MTNWLASQKCHKKICLLNVLFLLLSVRLMCRIDLPSATMYESILLFKIQTCSRAKSSISSSSSSPSVTCCSSGFCVFSFFSDCFLIEGFVLQFSGACLFSLSELTFSFGSITIGLQSCRQQHFNVKISSWDNNNVCYITLIDFLRLWHFDYSFLCQMSLILLFFLPSSKPDREVSNASLSVLSCSLRSSHLQLHRTVQAPRLRSTKVLFICLLILISLLSRCHFARPRRSLRDVCSSLMYS